MKHIINKHKKEDGNYINFALSGMLVMALMIILYVFEFRVQINSLENHITTGVQMAEDSILSASNPSTLHAKEQDRYHIIINASVNPNNKAEIYTTERNQIDYLTKYFLQQIKDTFYLDNDNIATSGELHNLQVGKTDALIVERLTIYEAIYSDEISYNKLKTHNYDNIRYFIKYDIKLSDNQPTGLITKTVLQKNEAKINGKLLEGSTVDSCIKSTVYINSYSKRKNAFPINISKDVQMGIVSAAHDSRLVK